MEKTAPCAFGPRDCPRRAGRRFADDGEWLTFRGLAEDRVPELVGEIVRDGGRVYAVEPRHETLEDRFLELLQEQGDSPSPSGGGRGGAT